MKRLLLVLATMLTMLAHGARAEVIVTLDSVGEDVFGPPGFFLWTYRATLQPDQLFREQDFFTIYDFPNLSVDPGSINVSFSKGATLGADIGFVVSVQNQGVDAPGLTFDDDPNITNVTVSLSQGGDIDPGVTALTLGNVIIRSPYDLRADSQYGALALVKENNFPNSNQGQVQVAAIPEPRSAVLMIAGLVAIGALSVRRRQANF